MHNVVLCQFTVSVYRIHGDSIDYLSEFLSHDTSKALTTFRLRTSVPHTFIGEDFSALINADHESWMTLDAILANVTSFSHLSRMEISVWIKPFSLQQVLEVLARRMPLSFQRGILWTRQPDRVEMGRTKFKNPCPAISDPEVSRHPCHSSNFKGSDDGLSALPHLLDVVFC